jgi:hypothetical protein
MKVHDGTNDGCWVHTIKHTHQHAAMHNPSDLRATWKQQVLIKELSMCAAATAAHMLAASAT